MPRRFVTVALAALCAGAAALPLARSDQRAQAAAPSPPDPVLIAAGDVGRCAPKPPEVDTLGDETTAGLVTHAIDHAPPGTDVRVALLGDGAYPTGTLAEYQNCYHPSWGAFYDRTWPLPGNHDYDDDPTAAGYYGYFGARFSAMGASAATAGNPAKGYYSYDLGAWHVIVLNSNCSSVDGGRFTTHPGGLIGGCGAGSVQQEWLKADLAATEAKCMVAMWHAPRFYSAAEGSGTTPDPSSDKKMGSAWEVLQAAGADVVLGGHHHIYERFAPMNPTGPQGTTDPNGMRSFVVGTGGGTAQSFPPGVPVAFGSERRLDQVFGVLRLTLHDTTYDWDFVAADGTPAGTVLDSGRGEPCRTDLPTSSTGAPPATNTPGPTTSSTTPTTPPAPPAPTAPPAAPGPAVHRSADVRSGYWMVGADGTVYPFGQAGHFGDARPGPGAQAVDLEPAPDGAGYWVVDSAGRVSARGSAADHGSADRAALAPGERVTSLSGTPSGHGYWLFTTRGRVLTRGDATHHGDMAAVTLNGPVLDSIPTPSGDGYYMVASDGGIFAFGDAGFHGSMGGTPLNAPVQSLVPDRDGQGYWLVAADGGIFAFAAPFHGSMGAVTLNRPVTGMVRFGTAYLMVGEDGGIFNFSDRAFFGSLGANPPASPIASVAVLD